MKQTVTYTALLLTAIVVSFGFSILNERGKVHLKVTKEENGEKSVFEKVYSNMEDLKSDEELKEFDVLVDQWATNDNQVIIHEKHEDGQKKIIIKKKIDADDDLTWVSEDDEEIHADGKRIIIKKTGDEDEIIEIKGEKVIKIKSDGNEEVFTITSEGDGENTMVWIDENGKKTQLTEENMKILAEDGEHIEVHKKIEVITSEDKDGEKNVFIMEGDDEDMTKVEVEVEKEIDDGGNEVIVDKKVWITKDGKKVELDDEDSFEFKTEGDQMTIVVDGKTIDIADFSGGEFEGDKVMVITSDGEENSGTKQTMNINVEEKNGEQFIEIDIKRNSELNVTISDILKNDDSLEDSKIDLKNNLKTDQLKYYPNPNDGKFNLSFKLDQKEEVTVMVMDILGNEVYKEELLDFNGVYDNKINLSGKQKGIYILQIKQKKKALTRKILIE